MTTKYVSKALKKQMTISPLAKYLGEDLVEQFREAINAVDEATYKIEDLYNDLEQNDKMERVDEEAFPSNWSNTCTVDDAMAELQDVQRIMNNFFDALEEVEKK